MDKIVCTRCGKEMFIYRQDSDYGFCLFHGLQYIGQSPLEKAHTEPRRKKLTRESALTNVEDSA